MGLFMLWYECDDNSFFEIHSSKENVLRAGRAWIEEAIFDAPHDEEDAKEFAEWVEATYQDFAGPVQAGIIDEELCIRWCEAGAGNAWVNDKTEPVQVFLAVEGGVVRGATADRLVAITVADYDEKDDAPDTALVPQPNDKGEERAWVYGITTSVDPQECALLHSYVSVGEKESI